MKTLLAIILIVTCLATADAISKRTELHAVWEPESKSCQICRHPLGTFADAPFWICHLRPGLDLYAHTACIPISVDPARPVYHSESE